MRYITTGADRLSFTLLSGYGILEIHDKLSDHEGIRIIRQLCRTAVVNPRLESIVHTMSSKRIVIAFDLFGTLLSASSIATKSAEYFSRQSRCYYYNTSTGIHLAYKEHEYVSPCQETLSNQRSIANCQPDHYQNSSDVTHNALLHVLRAHSVTLPPVAITALMKSYDSLSPFPDVPAALSTLSSHPNIIPVIFSNVTRNGSVIALTTRPSSPRKNHALRNWYPCMRRGSSNRFQSSTDPWLRRTGRALTKWVKYGLLLPALLMLSEPGQRE